MAAASCEVLQSHSCIFNWLQVPGSFHFIFVLESQLALFCLFFFSLAQRSNVLGQRIKHALFSVTGEKLEQGDEMTQFHPAAVV